MYAIRSYYEAAMPFGDVERVVPRLVVEGAVGRRAFKDGGAVAAGDNREVGGTLVPRQDLGRVAFTLHDTLQDRVDAAGAVVEDVRRRYAFV